MPEGVGFPFPSLHLNEGRTYGQPEVVRISLPQVATGLRLRLPGSFRRRAFHADLLMPQEALLRRGRSGRLLLQNQMNVLPEINARYSRKGELDDGNISFYGKDCRTE